MFFLKVFFNCPKPYFVDYTEAERFYVIFSGFSNISVFIPKFVPFKSQLSGFKYTLSSFSAELKTFYQILHVKGIGFKAYYYSKEHSVYFNIGYNHLCKFSMAFSWGVKVRKQYILIFRKAISLISVAKEIIQLRKPDPYRGKGIRFRFQEIKFKPGKQR